MIFRLVGADSAGELARRLLVSAVKLTLTAEEVQSALAHTVEGITTPLVRQEAPRQSGDLQASLHAHVERDAGSLAVQLESTVPYATFVQHGTGIYAQPTHSAWDVDGFQHFVIGGRDIYTQHTHHLGQQPNDFVGRGTDRAAAPVRAALVAAGERLWVTFAEDF